MEFAADVALLVEDRSANVAPIAIQIPITTYHVKLYNTVEQLNFVDIRLLSFVDDSGETVVADGKMLSGIPSASKLVRGSETRVVGSRFYFEAQVYNMQPHMWHQGDVLINFNFVWLNYGN